jgi:hypothetical protein
MNFVISGAVASFVMCNNSIRIILLNYYYYYHRHYVLTFMHGIYCCMPETDHFSRVYSVAAVLYLQFVVHVMLFRMLNMFRTFTLVLSEVCVQCPI